MRAAVALCYPNEHTKSRILKEEIRQALREGKILFLVGKKKFVDCTNRRCNQLLRVDGL